MTKRERKERGCRHPFLIHLLCIAAACAAAFFIRALPPSFLRGEEKVRDAWTDEEGLPYLTDMDSYYHVRLVDQDLRTGRMGDTALEDGSAWDTRSHYPEGRSAAYQPGIIRVTEWIWKLTKMTGARLEDLEYRIGAFVAALAALAAYVLGWRICGVAAGLASGLLVGCAPIYAARTCFGRFDTDMFVVLMEILLILSLTEALRAADRGKRAVSAAAFAGCAALYSQCWTPQYGMLFAGLTLCAGVLFCIISHTGRKPGVNRAGTGNRIGDYTGKTTGNSIGKYAGDEWVAVPDGGVLFTLILSAGLSAALLWLLHGPGVFVSILQAFSFTTDAAGSGEVLPNLLGSVSELERVRLLPETFSGIFSGHLSAASPALVCALGGAAAVLAALAGFVRLLAGCFEGGWKYSPEKIPARLCLLYACVLGSWLAAGVYLSMQGIRFAEHLCIPVGVLAGSLFGAWPAGSEDRKKRITGRILRTALGAAVIVPALAGAALTVRDNHPSVSDASVKAMNHIRKNAQDEDAVIASWWDMGYFYESESGHPCLWDGGTQNDGIRALLVSKALTAHDLALSQRILLMLSASGNEAVSLLMEHADAGAAFEALTEAIVLEESEGLKVLRSRCALDESEAQRVWALMRPERAKETWLVLTSTMARQIGWYEYYAGWDFTGTQPLPAATLFEYTPEGTPLFRSGEGLDYLADVREKEMIWRLFFNAEKTPYFTPAFEWHDGLEHVRVWRVEA